MRDLLFLQHRPIHEWRALAEASHRAQYDRLLRYARTYLERRPPGEHPDDSITYIGAAVANLGLAYLLSREIVFFDALRDWIRIAIGYSHWGKHRKPDHDLDAAWLLFGLGLVYDWLKHEMPSDEGEALRDKLVLQGRRMFEYAEEVKGDWRYHFWQNHNWICFAGLATAGYALMDDLPEAGAWCETALENFKRVFALLPDDGSDYEGPVYWRYGVPWLLIADDLFEQQADETLRDLSGFLEHTFYFRLYISGPNLVDTAHFGDCHDRRSAHSKAILYRLAGLYRNGYAQWLAYHFDRTGEWEREAREGLVKPGLDPEAFLEFLWFDPTVEPDDLRDLPLQRVFPDLGLVSVRTGWDEDATVLVYKCGQPSGYKPWHYGHILQRTHGWHTISAGHAHPDENSFVLMRKGDYLVVDEGYNRSCYSQYHSTVLVDGKGQYQEGGYNVFEGLGPEWGGRLEAWFGMGSLAYARGDAARAYDRSLKLQRCTREVLFLDGDLILLRDSLRAEIPHLYQWLLQTDVPVQERSERTFELQVGDTRMGIHVCEPREMQYEVRKQEIAANPTSAKPDWVLRREQYSFAIESSSATEAADFLVVLTLSPADVESLSCASGEGVRVAVSGGEWLVGFSSGCSGVAVEGVLDTDARWIALLAQSGKLTRYAAGDVSLLWWQGRPLVVAAPAVAVAMDASDDELVWTISASRPTWISLWTPWAPRKVMVGGESVPFAYRHDVALMRLAVPEGETVLTAYAEI